MENTVQEARRYLSNAREILSEKAKKNGIYYNDIKYVKLAGRAAYSGVLVALDGLLGKKDTRKSVEWYQEKLGKVDKKALTAFNSAYKILHLSMAYDGIELVSVSKDGLKQAEALINWVETRTAAA
ncbi:DUF5618 family protein [Dyadobacter fermentans]|uniref:DUF5618 domain-containing protein n=1 Tax=Dyadobacter fermentans (strain ATCC 700827 / DSM 18053 / CIP 107007 / KCTC 52180 / NS114) TaxID=471854 RepID=C6VY68_DYAFD|nr:DUF5618 family protein [Dyadobacter fermentans]ACT96969.1 hypothetical protein Dfer_5781 [Dyadobacter fermentans DSM 18053]